MTSPPYYNQRDYGIRGQIGTESNVNKYLDNLYYVFDELRRVLRDDGTCFINIGDVYINKALQGIPWKFADKMSRNGWTVRNEIIWWKRNAMTETVQDRCGRDHEVVFLFTKTGQDYFYENYESTEKTKDERERPHRTVWDIPTQSFRGSHFATFPIELAKRCIRLGTSAYGCCPKCEAPAKRVLLKTRIPTRPGNTTKTTGKTRKEKGNRDPQRHITIVKKIGWESTCKHSLPGLWSVPKMNSVIDPFCGSGTVGVACRELNDPIGLYEFTGIELNPEYAKMADKRIKEHSRIPLRRKHG